MNSAIAPLKCLAAGLAVMLLQLAVAVCLAAPEGPLWYRYSTLIQHDGYWFANIVSRGYGTTVPPISHKMMEVSNVAFFPAYPLAATWLGRLFHLSTYNALLVTAQAAAWGSWTYVFLLFESWGLSFLLRFFGTIAIASHPAAFFLVAGYSESLFIMALVGFIYWSNRRGRAAAALAVAHGFIMSATRIVGVVCAGFPVVQSAFRSGWSGAKHLGGWLRRQLTPAIISALSILGGVSFFLYCQLRWGCWNLYMLTQEAGWAIEPDYLAVFKAKSYHWLVPALHDPSEASQLTMSLGAVFFGLIAICELVPAWQRRTAWTTRIGLYFCAAAIYYVSVSGVASVEMESMLRYEFCVHVLMVLGVLHYLNEFRMPAVLLRTFGMAVISVAAAAGFALQGFYVWNFTRGNWVA